MKRLVLKHLGLAAAALAFSGSALAQSAPWDRLQQDGAVYAGTMDERKNAVEFVCPVTGAPQLIVISPEFRVSVPNDHRYSLTFVTDRGRSELVATAKDAELIFEAADLNAQVTLQRLMADIAASKTFTVAVSPFGWKGTFTGAGAAQALTGMMQGC
jgi:hypothetical protein